MNPQEYVERRMEKIIFLIGDNAESLIIINSLKWELEQAYLEGAAAALAEELSRSIGE